MDGGESAGHTSGQLCPSEDMALFGFRHYLECQMREQEGIAANSSYDCGYLLVYLATGQGFQGGLGVQAVVSHCAHVLWLIHFVWEG